MNIPTQDMLPDRGTDHSTGILKVAIMAVGGQGGGVLSNWIADLAEHGGYDAQMTSVAGVAQRTGATIYYIEMAPKSDKRPVFALSPAPGDVDVLIASELMEAGRAVMRGFVTPDRTTLIASSHRIWFGLTLIRENGDFAGRFQTILPAEEFMSGEPFEVVLNLTDYELDPSLAQWAESLPKEPYGLIVQNIWCHTLWDPAGLEVSEIELMTPADK